MKLKLGLFLCSLCLISSTQTQAAKLPDACGDDKVRFDVKLQKDAPAPSDPAPGKAQIVLLKPVKSLRQLAVWDVAIISPDLVWMEPGWAPPKTTPTSHCR